MKGPAASVERAEPARMPIQARSPEGSASARGVESPLQQLADASPHVSQLRRLGGVMNREASGGPGRIAAQRQAAPQAAQGIVQKVDASHGPKLKQAYDAAVAEGAFKEDVYYQKLNELAYPNEDDACEREPDEPEPAQLKSAGNIHSGPIELKALAPTRHALPTASYVAQAKLIASHAAMAPIQFARAAHSITGPKNYTASNGTALNNIVYQTDGLGNIDFANPSQYYIGNAYPGFNPVTAGSTVNIGAAVGTYGKADRYQHFKSANNQLPAFGGANGSSPAGLTWHHLTAKYYMHLVDRTVHGKHGHNGGVHIW